MFFSFSFSFSSFFSFSFFSSCPMCNKLGGTNRPSKTNKFFKFLFLTGNCCTATNLMFILCCNSSAFPGCCFKKSKKMSSCRHPKSSNTLIFCQKRRLSLSLCGCILPELLLLFDNFFRFCFADSKLKVKVDDNNSSASLKSKGLVESASTAMCNQISSGQHRMAGQHVGLGVDNDRRQTVKLPI